MERLSGQKLPMSVQDMDSPRIAPANNYSDFVPLMKSIKGVKFDEQNR